MHCQIKISVYICAVFVVVVVTSLPNYRKSKEKEKDVVRFPVPNGTFNKSSIEKRACSRKIKKVEEEEPQYCYIGDGVYIKEGEQVPAPIGECTAIHCVSATPLAMQISTIDCSWLIPRPGCRISEYNSSKRYPNCCPHEIC